VKVRHYQAFLKAKSMWDFILMYATDPANNGQVPSYREIMAQTGISSTSMVSFYMEELQKQGLIEFTVEGGRYSIAGAQLVPPMREFVLPEVYEY
jgi:DNA-binding transcriptional regulator YhcF (GntR family)